MLQFDPATETVQRRPLLIIPPWINKYYILDLQPRNSFIRWASAQGLTVFVVSWVNPDADLAEKSFADYMREGPLAALDAIAAATGEREVNAIGYCIGGTLLATTLAHMAARGDDRIASATFFTSLVDFSEAGDLQVFIDEEQLTNLERKMDRDGYLDGSDMSTTFNMLRANDLIWSFVINNYLMGRDPFPSICCIGMPIAPVGRHAPIAIICAICTSIICWSNRAPWRSMRSPSTLAKSPSQPLFCQPRKITSRHGRRPTRRRRFTVDR